MENKTVIINKLEIVERCIKRIEEEYENNPANLEDYKRLDCIVLNLQRACEAVIDVAMYIVSSRKLGVPQTKKEAIDLLYNNDLINKEMHNNIKNMVGFRNIAVHDYKKIDNSIIEDVIQNHLRDLIEFVKVFL